LDRIGRLAQKKRITISALRLGLLLPGHKRREGLVLGVFSSDRRIESANIFHVRLDIAGRIENGAYTSRLAQVIQKTKHDRNIGAPCDMAEAISFALALTEETNHRTENSIAFISK
jgi:hypothetical protein